MRLKPTIRWIFSLLEGYKRDLDAFWQPNDLTGAFSLADMRPKADADNDGLTNRVEVRAKTNPFNPNSFFHATLERSGGNVVMEWHGEDGAVRYRLETPVEFSLVQRGSFSAKAFGRAGNPLPPAFYGIRLNSLTQPIRLNCYRPEDSWMQTSEDFPLQAQESGESGVSMLDPEAEIRPAGNGKLFLVWQGSDGMRYVVKTSARLVDWFHYRAEIRQTTLDGAYLRGLAPAPRLRRTTMFARRIQGIGNDMLELSFDTVLGRLYTLETSDDLGISDSWHADSHPEAQFYGTGEEKIFVKAIASGEASRFWRLRYEPDSEFVDSDSDGLFDWQEVLLTGTDKDDSDTDGDGLPDGWEVEFGLDPLSTAGVNGGAGDFDGDGLSNFTEFNAGSNPSLQVRISDPTGDVDSDGVINANDGFFDNAAFTFPPVPATQYVVIDIGSDDPAITSGFRPVALNNKGEVVGYKGTHFRQKQC